MFDFLRRKTVQVAVPAEARATVMANGSVKISDATGMVQILGLESTSAGAPVTIDSALGVPAIWAAVNFLSKSLASLPLQVFRRTGNETKRVSADLERILNEAWNDQTSSFEARKYCWDQTFTGGRQCSFIERNGRDQVIGIWPLNPEFLTIRRVDGRKIYEYRETATKLVTYDAAEVIDLSFMLKADGLSHRGPITANAEVISMCISATTFGGAFFRGGGVPPFAVTGNFKSGKAMQAAADQMQEAVKKAAREARQAVVLPAGLDIKPIGTDAEKAQLVETQKFLIEQVARIWGLPPVFVQVLAGLTYSNSEQQDLHLVKHTLHAWVRQFEDELNLKLFGPKQRTMYVRHNLDGLLRGDFPTRMDGYAKAIQHGVMTPNEARELEGRPGQAGGDQMFMQGAMALVTSLPAGGQDETKGQGNDG